MLRPVLLLALFTFSRLLAAEIQVVDDLGLPVALEHTAERVIALSPHATELMVAAGASSKLVAVASFHDYPPQLNDLPVVSHFSGLDRERLVMLKPDLVVAWASGNKPNDIAWLKSMGIPVYLSEPSGLQDIPNSIEKLGNLTAQQAFAQQSAKRFRSLLDKTCANRRGQPLLTTYYEIWPSPPMTIGNKHWLNRILAKARLSNTFGDQNRQILTVSPESLIARPISIIISNFQQTKGIPITAKRVRGNDQLARPGPRIIEGLQRLCAQL